MQYVAFEHRTCFFYQQNRKLLYMYMFTVVSFPGSQTAKWLVHYIVCERQGSELQQESISGRRVQVRK